MLRQQPYQTAYVPPHTYESDLTVNWKSGESTEDYFSYLESMKKITLNERLIRIVGIPIVSIIFMLLYNYDELTTPLVVEQEFVVSLTFTFALWEGNRAIVYNFRKWYPHNDQTAKRLLLQMPIIFAFTVTVSLLIDFTFGFFGVVMCEPGEKLIYALTNLLPAVFIMSIYEGAYFFEEWKKNFQRSEALAKENIRSQFEALKSQLDPHFLFNSMNTLAALIHPDNTDAQKYLEQLSDVYRYVLLSRQKETVSLEEELEFVQSYIFLNKTRYRDNLIVENDIPEESLNRRVAPLSLQILVENALKHNVISKDKPLTLRITVDRHGYVVVENNVQKKNILEMEKSTKTGLQNIVNRYALLTPSPVEINQSAELFSVRIPLIAS